ncbi:MAG: hypothetical protein AB8G15_10820 [Saprospiraceae bacterium]
MTREKSTKVIKQASIICWAFLLLMLATPFLSKAQDSTFHYLAQIPVQANFFTTDNLKQVYVVSHKNELIKYNSQLEEVFRFSNNTLGQLTYVDVTNPFNILLYYPDFRALITLDRTLNKTGEFDLFDLDIEEVKAVALSNDNNIWLYDDVTFKIKKINRQGKKLVESDNLSFLLGHTISPNFILEKANKLYVNSPEHGVLIFDLFGRYQHTLSIKGLERFQIEGGHLVYYQAEQLFSFHLKSLLTKSSNIPHPEKGIGALHIQRATLYLQREKQIELYRF